MPDDYITQALLGTRNVLRMPSQAARGAVASFDDLVERAKREATSAALGGDFDPQPGMELATGAIGGGTPFAVRGALGAAGGKVIQPPGIRAYHGSPHDFERFDMSKIGTGEGAQSYGHGLYFAEKEGVARDYRNKLAPNRLTLETENLEVPRTPLLSRDELERDAGRYLTAHQSFERAKQVALVHRNYEVLDQLEQWEKRGAVPKFEQAGKMYEVNIRAEPQQFLDWDKPLAGQPVPVVGYAKDAWHGEPSPLLTGKDIYHSPSFKNPADTMAFFKDAGIPGIKYLDQGSRQPKILFEGNPIVQGREGNLAAQMAAEALDLHKTPEMAAMSLRRQHHTPYKQEAYDAANLLASGKVKFHEPQGTSNYVLFRDDIIDILRKYGLMGAAPAGGAAAMTPQDRNAIADWIGGMQQ